MFLPSFTSKLTMLYASLFAASLTVGTIGISTLSDTDSDVQQPNDAKNADILNSTDANSAELTSIASFKTQPNGNQSNLFTSNNTNSAQEYLVGAAKADITGAAAESGMFGYAASQSVEGINDRLYSHAFIIGDDDKRVVFVSADMGAMFTSIKLEVIKRLKEQFGDMYNDDNVMLTATHTHVGNGGHSHQQLYQIASFDDTTFGYSSQNFEAAVSGIVNSIKRAHQNLEPGTLSLAQGELKGVTLNRSIPAYNKNPDAINYDSNVNETMTQLRLDSADGTPLGLINWFAIHPTSFSNQFMHLSADNKGFAQLGAQEILGEESDKPFIAAFANADEGDVIAIGGNANSKHGYEGSNNEWENVIRDGQLQLDKAVELWDQGKPVMGPIDVRARWVDLYGYQVDGEFTNGAGSKTLCLPARGYSFAAGGENGPTDIPGVYEGMTKDTFSLTDDKNKIDETLIGTLTRGVFGVISVPNQDDCQEEKQVLIPTGGWGWINTTQPVQLMRIGNLAIVSIPGEPTTMVGRRMRAAVLEQLKDYGVDTVIVNGLANNYSGYFSTREEYSAQHYEGASTEYGPYQTNAYIQEYTMLAQAMRDGRPVYDTATPPDRSGSFFAERAGVMFDDKPFFEKWGQELTAPQSKYQMGDTASAVFRGAHPKNNLRTGNTFLKIQRQVDGQWVDYLTDSDFDTTYTWKRDGISYSKVTIEWRIGDDTPKGKYRIVHQGDWKNGWNFLITPYTGYSSKFEVS